MISQNASHRDLHAWVPGPFPESSALMADKIAHAAHLDGLSLMILELSLLHVSGTLPHGC